MLIFHLFFVVVVLLLSTAALLFALVMPRTAVAISAALAVAHLEALGVWVSTSWAAPSTSWAVFDQLSAEQVHRRAAAMLPLLPWAVAPLVACAVAAFRRPSWWRVLLPASAPVLLMTVWLAESALTWRVDDARWLLNAQRAPFNPGGLCSTFLMNEAAFDTNDAQRLRAACRAVCDAQQARGLFSPGMLEDVCRHARTTP